jgi:hypothetical protein
VAALAVLACGAYSLYVRFNEAEPEVIRNALVCPDCGKPLPKADAPCIWCQAKKAAEEIEAKARGEVPASKSENKKRVVLGLGALALILVLMYWPRIRDLLSTKEERNEFLIFHCLKCRRKLRYHASRAGMQGQCPSCKNYCIFPLPESNLPD